MAFWYYTYCITYEPQTPRPLGGGAEGAEVLGDESMDWGAGISKVQVR
jgi:hypothetical protein